MPRGLWIGLVVGFLAGIAEAEGPDPAPDAQEVAFFEAKVRPILVQRCYECHSNESKTLRGNLRLDSRSGWRKGGDLGPAIEPGKPDDSLLVQAIRWDDDALKMPPKGKLPDAEIAILTDWIRRGAPDPRSAPAASAAKPARVIDHEEGRKHWAFQPLHQVEPPAVRNETWCRTPIDRFILARLEAKGLTPAPPVEPARLARRLFYDLIGLPPTPEELHTFLHDEKGDPRPLISRLLASPHHGERWARHWLDLARFAESHGFEHDYDRPSAYHYRDFLIEAINQDLPYDTFVKWQLAGDELAPDNPLALKATGFLAAGVHSTQITANQAEKERYDELDDMIATTGTAFLGLTLGCARCHDHKYDPITNAEYYRLVATFTTTVRSEIDLDLDPEGSRKAMAAYEQSHAPYLQALAEFEKSQLPGRLDQWEKSRSEAPGSFPWLVLDLVTARSAGGATLTRQPDGSVLASGKAPDHETYTFVARVPQTGITAIRLEALADPSLVKNGPGRASNGNFALTDFKVAAKPLKGDGPPVDLILKNPRATFEQPGLPVAAAIDADGTSGWAVDPRFGQDHAAVFELAEPLALDSGAELRFTLRFANNLKHAIGRPRLSVTTSTEPVALDAPALPQAAEAVLALRKDQRSPDQQAALLAWYRTIDPEWRKLKQAEQDHERQHRPRPTIVKALISSEGVPAVRLHTQGPDFYEKTYMLRRGDPNQKVEEVKQGFLQVLMSPSRDEGAWTRQPPSGWHTSYRRTALADWMTDVNDGAGALLARVVVNRLWQHHFGRGLVATPSDFGFQGERPTDPELLDWLAAELIRQRWHLKPLHELILNSAVYQQDAHIDPEKARIDPENTLLWRQNRRRLEAEVIRDAMLAVSGLLDETMLGPGTLDVGMTRRSIYFMVKRSRLIPMMTLFDAPDALVPIAARSETTVAPQSLFLMNNPEVRKWAEAFARRVAPKDGASPVDAVLAAYRLALGRDPDPVELADAQAFLRQFDLADFCQVLLSTNEFIFIE